MGVPSTRAIRNNNICSSKEEVQTPCPWNHYRQRDSIGSVFDVKFCILALTPKIAERPDWVFYPCTAEALGLSMPGSWCHSINSVAITPKQGMRCSGNSTADCQTVASYG